MSGAERGVMFRRHDASHHALSATPVIAVAPRLLPFSSPAAANVTIIDAALMLPLFSWGSPACPSARLPALPPVLFCFSPHYLRAAEQKELWRR